MIEQVIPPTESKIKSNTVSDMTNPLLQYYTHANEPYLFTRELGYSLGRCQRTQHNCVNCDEITDISWLITLGSVIRKL